MSSLTDQGATMARLFTAIFLASVAAGSARSEIITHETPGHLTCEAGAGRFESRRIEQLAPGGRMAGRIRLIKAHPDPRWLPTAGFIYGITGGSNVATGIQLSMIPGDSDFLHALVRVPGGGARTADIGRVPTSEWIPVSVSHNSGVLEVNVAGTIVRRRLRNRTGMQPMLMCNSGEFEFELEEGVVHSAERFQQR